MTTEIIRVYAHDSNDDELAYELADAFADPSESMGDKQLHTTLRGLAYEVEVYYELDTDTGEIELIGMKESGVGELGRCPDPTWTHGEDDDDGIDDPDHMAINVIDAETGEKKSVLACKIGEDDVEDDGTISFPVSGECPHDDT